MWVRRRLALTATMTTLRTPARLTGITVPHISRTVFLSASAPGSTAIMAAADSTVDVTLADVVGDMKAAAVDFMETGAAVISGVMVSVVVIFMVKASAAVILMEAGATVEVATHMAAGVTKAADLMAAEATKAEVLMGVGTDNVRNRTRDI
jgi:hypothetical protein